MQYVFVSHMFVLAEPDCVVSAASEDARKIMSQAATAAAEAMAPFGSRFSRYLFDELHSTPVRDAGLHCCKLQRKGPRAL